MLGKANGTFGPATNFPTGNGPQVVAVADFNGDGKKDLVTADFFDNEAAVLLGNGDGTFGPPVSFAAGYAPNYVTALDINGDGKQDLAVSDYLGNSGAILLSIGDGTFGNPLCFMKVDDATLQPNRNGVRSIVGAKFRKNVFDVTFTVSSVMES